MHTLDVLILIMLAIGLMRGFATGVIRQAASIVGLLAAFVLSVQLMEPTGVLVTESLDVSPSVAPLVGFVLVFLAVQVAVFALARIVENLVGALRLTVVNRVLGGVVGAFKAALALSVLFLVIGSFGVPEEPAQEASLFYDPVSSALPAAWDYVSDRLPEVERLSEKFGDRVARHLSDAKP